MNADPVKSEKWVKSARTLHLTWSLGFFDNKVIDSLAGFLDHNVVVSEKMDGENISIYGDGLHARSLDSASHPSQIRVKVLQSRLREGYP